MFQDYCTGCGLCVSVKKVLMKRDERGLRIISENKENDAFYSAVCPAGGWQCSYLKEGAIWGRERGVFLSYSTDAYIRHMASSGGVLTAISLYLIETKKVDGIIHIKQDQNEPIETEIACSYTRDEVLECMGSRYSSSMPLAAISEYIGNGKKYAFVGKPCDVTALRNYMLHHAAALKSFPYLLSFFCAGAPSRDANLNLLNKLGCAQSKCADLRYRGNGWPGYATATDHDGKEYKMTYRNAWRDTLGRDIRKICRLCLDGIGEAADISCGDAWYLDDKNQPVFDESEGRNVVFCRTEAGRELFDQVCKAGYVERRDYDNFEKELSYSQAYQYDRRASMAATLSAMKFLHRKIPQYDKKLVHSYSKNISIKKKLIRFRGTLKRALEGKL